MALIAITGGIGSGKSTVSRMLIERGYPLIDTDQIAREIVRPGEKAYQKLVDTFGDGILDDQLELDRKKLALIIFGDESKRKLCNSIMHPIIRTEVLKKVFFALLYGEKLIFIDVPLLYESKSLLPFVQKVIVVSCDREQQIERVIKRNQFSAEEVESRVNAQMDLKLKCEMADYVIDNSGEPHRLAGHLDETLSKISRLNLHFRNLAIFRALLLSLTITTGFSFWKLLNLIGLF